MREKTQILQKGLICGAACLLALQLFGCGAAQEEENGAQEKKEEQEEVEEAAEEYPLHLTVYAANEAATDEEGNLLSGQLTGNVEVSLRSGASNYDGDVVATGSADGSEEVSISLESGSYTAQISADGYMTTWLNVEVDEQETWCTGWVVTAPESNQLAVVLTWEDENADLDLMVMTGVGSGEEISYVGGNVSSDENGNALVSDNTCGAEVVYVNAAGSYGIYVNDYTDSVSGDYTADTLAKADARVYFYDSEGMIDSYTFPAGESGAVWEVAQILDGAVEESREVLTEIAGMTCWTADKYSLDMEEYDRLMTLINLMTYIFGTTDKYYEGNSEFLIRSASLDWEDMGSILWHFFAYYDFQEYISYDTLYEIAVPLPDEVSSHFDGYGITYSRIEDFAYWVTGREWNYSSGDLRFLGGSSSDFIEYTYEGTTYVELNTIHYGGYMFFESTMQNIKSDYLGNGRRIISGDYISEYFGEMGQVTAIIEKNEDSWFNGFNIVSVGVSFYEWITAYCEYFYPDMLSSMNDYSYAEYVYVPGSEVPIFYVNYARTSSDETLYYYNDGEVEEIEFYYGYCIPEKGLFQSYLGRMEDYSVRIYQVVGGVPQLIASGSCIIDFYSIEVEDLDAWFDDPWYDTYIWNDQEVTEDEYNSSFDAIWNYEESIELGYASEEDSSYIVGLGYSGYENFWDYFAYFAKIAQMG